MRALEVTLHALVCCKRAGKRVGGVREKKKERKHEGKERVDRGDERHGGSSEEEKRNASFSLSSFSLSFCHSDSPMREELEHRQAPSLAKRKLLTKGSAEAAPQRRGPSERASKSRLLLEKKKDKTAPCVRAPCVLLRLPPLRAFAGEKRVRAPHKRKEQNASTQESEQAKAKKETKRVEKQVETIRKLFFLFFLSPSVS